MAVNAESVPVRETTAASTAATSARARRDLLVNAGLLALYAGLSLLKMRAYYIGGRMWAEEGSIFFADMAQSAPLHDLLYIYHGHLSLVTNVVVLAATLVNFKSAPLVLVYLSWLVQSVPIAILIAWREQLAMRPLQVAVFCVLLAGLPQAAEVWANATNLHFHLALLTALIAALPLFTGYPKLLFRVLLLVCGLTSLPSDFLLPLFVVMAFTSRNRERYIQSAILAATSLLQLSLLLSHHFDTGGRSLAFNPLTIWLAIVAQQFFSPFFGLQVGNQLAAVLAGALRFGIDELMFAAICSIPLLYAAWRLIASRDRRAVLLLGASALLAVLSAGASLDDKPSLISSWIGGRYFFAPSACLMLALLMSTSALSRNARIMLFAVLTITALPRLGSFLGGPPWPEAYAAAVSGNADTVAIWPDGWTVPNRSRHAGGGPTFAATLPAQALFGMDAPSSSGALGQPAAPTVASVAMARQCIGAVEQMVPAASVSGAVRLTDELALRGWLATSDAGSSPQRTLIVLIDSHRKPLFAATVAEARSDVVASHGRESLLNSGFKTRVALSDLPSGRYLVALGQLSGTTLEVCPNWHAAAVK